MKVAIYARVSTDEQAQEGTSLETQLAKLRQWTAAYGHTIYDEYVDGGFSGKDDKRPALRRLMLDAQSESFEVVVTTKLDRLFRNLRLLIEYHEQLEKLNISYICHEFNVDTSTITGRLMFNMLGSIAQWERELIADRNQGGIRRTLEKQLMAGGKHLFGYARGEDKKPVVRNEEATVVRLIYSLYLSGLGVSRVAEKLNQSKERLPKPSMRSKGWNDSSVLWVLRHPAYSGQQFTMNRKGSWDFQSGDIIVQEGTYPAIIERAHWDAVQERMKSQKRLGRHDPGKAWLLQNMIHCAVCGSVYRCSQHRANQQFYSCWGRNKIRHLDGSDKCTSRRFRAEDFDKAVWETFSAAIRDKDILRQSILNSIRTADERRKELAALCEPVDKRLTRLKEALRRRNRMYEEGQLSDDQWKSDITTLTTDIKALEKQRCDIDPLKSEELTMLEGYVAWAKEFWPKADLALASDGSVHGRYLDDTVDALIDKGRRQTTPKEWQYVDDAMDGHSLNLDTGLEKSPSSQSDGATDNRRRLMQRFGCGVWVGKDGSVELRGHLPTQMVKLPDDLGVESVSRMR